MAITLRTVKGSALTHLELDTNFTDIDANTGTTYNTLRIYADSNAYNTYNTLTANLYNTFAYLNANSSQGGAGTLANDYNTYLFASSNDYNTYTSLTANTYNTWVGLNSNIQTVSSNLNSLPDSAANDFTTYDVLTANTYDTYSNLYALVTGYSYDANGNGIPTITSNTSINLIAQVAVDIAAPAVLRLPRMNTSIRNAAAAQAGDMIYNIETETFQGYTTDSDGLGNPGWVDLH